MTIPLFPDDRSAASPLPEIERPRGLRERLAALRYLPRWCGSSGRRTAATPPRWSCCACVRAFVPVATLWAAKLIIDQVVLLTRDARRARSRRCGASSALELGDRRRRRAARARVGARGVAARRPVLEPHQRAAHAARRDARPRAVRGSGLLRSPRARAAPDDGAHRAHRACCSRMGQDALTLVHARRGARRAQPVAAAAARRSRSCRASSARRTSPRSSYSLLFRRTPERRELDYLRYVGASDKTAKEVQMFGLAGWLTDRYARARRSATTRRTGSSASGRASSARCCRSSARSATTARTSRSSLRAVAGAITPRHAHLPRRGVRAQPRPDPAPAALGERHLRAEPLSAGTCSSSSR